MIGLSNTLVLETERMTLICITPVHQMCITYASPVHSPKPVRSLP